MTLDDLRKAMDATRNAPPKEITVPVWGKLWVRPQTVEEADEAADRKPDDDGRKRRLARNAAQVICNEAGERLFDVNNREQLDYLCEQPWELLHKVVQAATGIYSSEALEEKK